MCECLDRNIAGVESETFVSELNQVWLQLTIFVFIINLSEDKLLD